MLVPANSFTISAWNFFFQKSSFLKTSLNQTFTNWIGYENLSTRWERKRGYFTMDNIWVIDSPTSNSHMKEKYINRMDELLSSYIRLCSSRVISHLRKLGNMEVAESRTCTENVETLEHDFCEWTAFSRTRRNIFHDSWCFILKESGQLEWKSLEML